MAPTSESDTPLTGGCLCGTLRYEIRKPFIDVGFCHCTMCQKASGAPAVAWIALAPEQFTYTHGQPKQYRSSPHAWREFCPSCGSPLLYRQTDGEEVNVTVASLDTPTLVTPDYHIWMVRHLPWVPIDDSLPQFDHDLPPDWRSTCQP